MELALQQSIHRSLIQGKLGHSDPDCVLVRSQGTPYEAKISEKGMSLEEARFFITVIGLTLGIQMVGEKMMDLEPERLELLDAILPVLPWCAQPLDFFAAKPTRLLTRTPHGLLLGLFNWEKEEATESVSWAELSLPEGKARDVFEFGTGSHLGRATESINVAIPAQGCRLLFLRDPQHRPAFLALGGHLSCGAAFLEGEDWDEGRGLLTISFSCKRSGLLYFFCSDSWRPTHEDARQVSGPMWSLALESETIEIGFRAVL